MNELKKKIEDLYFDDHLHPLNSFLLPAISLWRSSVPQVGLRKPRHYQGMRVGGGHRGLSRPKTTTTKHHNLQIIGIPAMLPTDRSASSLQPANTTTNGYAV